MNRGPTAGRASRRSNRFRRAPAAAFIAALLVAGNASAGQPIVTDVVADDRGWYENNGDWDGGNPSNPDQPNYAAGISQSNREFRNWFTFDMSVLPQRITAVTLNLGMPSGSDQHPTNTGGYRSADPSEHYVLRDVGTAIPLLVNGNGGVPAFQDLGDGHVYGEYTMTEADEGQIVSIDLTPIAVLHADRARATGRIWALGGHVTTILPDVREEIIFAGSHVEPAQHVFLTVTMVPAPATLALLLVALPGRRRPRRRRGA